MASVLGFQSLVELDEPYTAVGARIVRRKYSSAFAEYQKSSTVVPLLLLGDSKRLLKRIPDDSIDCVMDFSSTLLGKKGKRNMTAVASVRKKLLVSTLEVWKLYLPMSRES